MEHNSIAVQESAENTVSGDQIHRLVSRVTAEHVAYLLIAVLAGVMRFVDLGLAPLNSNEAGEALAVWQQWLPGNLAVTPGSPAYLTLTAFLTQVAGFSDSIMRLIPAVFGFALVLMPWLLRHRTGRLGALIAALLLALSPLQIATARTAGGQSIALFAAMVVFITWLRYQETSNHRWLYGLAAALALGITSSSVFIGIIVTLIVAWLVQHVFGPALIRGDDGQRATFVGPSRTELLTAVVVGVATFLGLATALLFALRGVGSSFELFADWLSQFQITKSSYLISGPFVVLARYEVAIVLIGLPAAVWAAVKEKPFPLFLVYWALGSLVLIFVQQGTPSTVLLLSLPGSLLVGRFANDILDRPSSSWWWAFALVIFLASAILYLNLVRYARLAGLQGVPDPTYHLLIVFLALLATLILTLFLFSWDRAAAAKGLISGVLAVLLIFTWGSAWWLGHEAINDTRERWIEQGTADDIRLIRETIEELSWQVNNSVDDVVLASAIDSPALRWYLRDFSNATFATALAASNTSPVLITPTEYDPQVASNYIGAAYSYAHPNTVHTLDGTDSLRWWLFHQSPIPVSRQQLILWLRSDLAEAGS